MGNSTDPAVASQDGNAPPKTRVAFERLRERTDELELIMSGLLAFTLLTVPGKIFDAWARNSTHLDGANDVVLRFVFVIAVGLCYSLAIAFISHLAIRGYWIALIGLKATFPDGIRWDRIPLMGEVSRPFYQTVVGDLGESIDRADRAGSILFAITILLALLMAWICVLTVAGSLVCGLIGSLFTDSDRATRIAMTTCYFAFLAVSASPMVLEKLIARRTAAGRASPRLVKLTRVMLRTVGLVIPQRLISSVQLTLQSNLPSRRFMVVYLLVVVAATVFGGLQVVNSTSFSLLNNYQVINTEAVDHGMHSAHYESMRSEHDLLRLYPMLPSDRISDTHLRLFIPHRPRIDNQYARQACPDVVASNGKAKGMQATQLAMACLTSLWTVTLDGKPVPLDDFVPTERRDLDLRGLLGYIPIAHLAPGRHDLHLLWNAGGGDEGELRQREYFIPFWFTPGIDQSARQDQPDGSERIP